jgi:hypothetical protein
MVDRGDPGFGAIAGTSGRRGLDHDAVAPPAAIDAPSTMASTPVCG